MNSLVRRGEAMVKSWWNAFLAPAEDPRRTFVDAYARQRELLDQVRRALGEIGEAKSRLEAKTAEVRAKLPQLEDQAREAISRDREDLARLALHRYQVGEVELRALEEQVGDVEREEQRLALVEQRLATQIEASYAREEVLAARYSAAEAQVHLKEALSGISEELSDLGHALEQAEEKTAQMQARATALDRLVEEGVLPATGVPGGEMIEEPLAQLDVAEAVERRLAELKRQVGTAGDVQHPEAGRG